MICRLRNFPALCSCLQCLLGNPPLNIGKDAQKKLYVIIDRRSRKLVTANYVSYSAQSMDAYIFVYTLSYVGLKLYVNTLNIYTILLLHHRAPIYVLKSIWRLNYTSAHGLFWNTNALILLILLRLYKQYKYESNVFTNMLRGSYCWTILSLSFDIQDNAMRLYSIMFDCVRFNYFEISENVF